MIAEWEWDDENVAHLGRHSVTPRIVREVSKIGPKFRENIAAQRATFQMIGPGADIEIWTICILESQDYPGRWRAITGWKATKAEKDWYWEVTR